MSWKIAADHPTDQPVLIDVVDRCVAGDAAVAQDRNPIGDPEYFFEMMRDEDDAEPLTA